MPEPNRAPLNDAPALREEAAATQRLPAETPAATLPGQAATPANPSSPAVAGDAAALRAEQEAGHLAAPDDRPEPNPVPGGL